MKIIIKGTWSFIAITFGIGAIAALLQGEWLMLFFGIMIMVLCIINYRHWMKWLNSLGKG